MLMESLFNGSPKGSINVSLDDLSKVSSADSVQLHTYISDTGVCNDHDKTRPLLTLSAGSPNSEMMWKTTTAAIVTFRLPHEEATEAKGRRHDTVIMRLLKLLG